MLPCSKTGEHQTIVRDFSEKAVWYQPASQQGGLTPSIPFLPTSIKSWII